MAKFTKDEFISGLKEMTILEVKELVDAMKEEFGVDPSSVAVAAPQAAAEANDEPSSVTLTLANTTLTELGPSSTAAAGAAATATALGSTPNSSFIASTNSLTSRIVISFNPLINSSFVNFAILHSSFNYFSKS